MLYSNNNNDAQFSSFQADLRKLNRQIQNITSTWQNTEFLAWLETQNVDKLTEIQQLIPTKADIEVFNEIATNLEQLQILKDMLTYHTPDQVLQKLLTHHTTQQHSETHSSTTIQKHPNIAAILDGCASDTKNTSNTGSQSQATLPNDLLLDASASPPSPLCTFFKTHDANSMPPYRPTQSDQTALSPLAKIHNQRICHTKQIAQNLLCHRTVYIFKDPTWKEQMTQMLLQNTNKIIGKADRIAISDKIRNGKFGVITVNAVSRGDRTRNITQFIPQYLKNLQSGLLDTENTGLLAVIQFRYMDQRKREQNVWVIFNSYCGIEYTMQDKRITTTAQKNYEPNANILPPFSSLAAFAANATQTTASQKRPQSTQANSQNLDHSTLFAQSSTPPLKRVCQNTASMNQKVHWQLPISRVLSSTSSDEPERSEPGQTNLHP